VPGGKGFFEEKRNRAGATGRIGLRNPVFAAMSARVGFAIWGRARNCRSGGARPDLVGIIDGFVCREPRAARVHA